MKRNKHYLTSEYIECSEAKEIEGDEVFSNNKCRICLDTGDIPIFGDELTPDISNDIKIFASIEINTKDNLPKCICEACEKLLQAAVFFRKTAQQTDLYLKSQHQDESNATNTTTTPPPDHTTITPDVGYEIDNRNVDTENENTLIDIKEEIVVVPYIVEIDYTETENVSINAEENNDNEIDCTETENVSINAEENNDNDQKQIAEDSTVSLPKKQKHSCKICNINFKTAKAYSKHKKSIEHKKARNPDKVECEVCFKYISRAYYSRHLEIHSNDGKDDKLTCPICNKTYNKAYFNYHITHTHNQDDKKESERIQCTVCNKSYEKHYFKFHLAIHNNDSSRYVCDTCGKSFIQQSAFKRHHLIHSDELAYKCELCPYKGRHPGLLKTHMRTHSRVYQHRCMECPARFLTKSNLNKHVQRHKGPVDFKCESCKRGFYSKPELDRHLEADHLGVKNHVCNICGKAFGYRNAMMSHQLKVHKREKLTNGKGRVPLYLEADRINDACKLVFS